MIDKIDSNTRYEYPNVRQKKIHTTDAFESIDYAKKGVVYENEKENSITDPTVRKRSNTKILSDVNSKEENDLFTNRTTNDQDLSTNSNGLTFDQLKESVRSIVTFIKETWKLIWEDAPKQEAEVVDEIPLDTKTAVLPIKEDASNAGSFGMKPSQEADMKNVLKSGDMNSLSAVLTEYGKKKPARNTALLTTYDKRGRIVNVDAAEKEKILHGDKNFIKL